jgi:hypothetical protein
MISALIHIALISAKAVLALIATILIVPGLGRDRGDGLVHATLARP